ncbi:MAG: hypothetical protein LAQ69_31735, partial [Acidobacteriia bacterium]|nr:hypothetical protein [Terriglobia bacterium]
TRRSAETGTEEARGWEFETWGVGSFGELRQVRIGPHGTEVEIELRPEAVAAMASLDVSPEDFYGTLREYVSKLIVVAPCRFELTASVDGCKPLQIDPGWVTDETRMAEELVSGASRQLRGGESESAMTCTELDNQRGFEEVKDRHLRGLRQSVQFCGQVEGDLPDGLGRYRIILPYFALPDKSLVYLFLKKVGSETPDQVETAFGFQGVYPTYRTIWSWRGLECDLQASLESPSWFPCWVSVNLTHGLDARMPVHRDSVTVPDELLNRLRSFMEERVAEVHSNFLDSHRTSLYARLSAMVTGSIVPKGSSAHWAVLSAPNVWKWTALRYPTVARMDASRRVAWQGEECSVAAILKFVGFQAFRGESNRIDAFGIRFPCQRVVLASPFHFIPMWTVAPSSLDRESGRVWLAEFPKSQRSVLGCWNSIAGHGVVILNRDHPLSALARSNSFEWINRALSHGLHTRGDVPDAEQRAVLLQDKNAASDWMIACSLNSEADAMWKIVHEQDPSFWPVLWAGLAIEGQRNPIILLSEFGHMLIQRDAIVEPKFKQLAKFLPGPSPQDCLQYIPWKKPRKRSRSKLQ